jgi:hypothetical protein
VPSCVTLRSARMPLKRLLAHVVLCSADEVSERGAAV